MIDSVTMPLLHDDGNVSFIMVIVSKTTLSPSTNLRTPEKPLARTNVGITSKANVGAQPVSTLNLRSRIGFQLSIGNTQYSVLGTEKVLILGLS